MGTNVVFIGWDRPISGREQMATALFGEFTQYLDGLQQAGTIQSHQSVLLNPHGGDLNGFALIQGDSGNLDTLLSSEEWQTLITRGNVLLEGFGCLRGATGELLMKEMERYVRALPA